MMISTPSPVVHQMELPLMRSVHHLERHDPFISGSTSCILLDMSTRAFQVGCCACATEDNGPVSAYDLAVDWTRVCTKKQVRMIGKYHNHTLQMNPQHHEAEPHNNNNHKTPGRQRKVKHSEDP